MAFSWTNKTYTHNLFKVRKNEKDCDKDDGPTGKYNLFYENEI
jgi:hypothetical protein